MPKEARIQVELELTEEQESGNIIFRVVDQNGELVEGATVTSQKLESVTTGVDGVAAFCAVPIQGYTFTFTHARATSSVERSVAPDEFDDESTPHEKCSN